MKPSLQVGTPEPVAIVELAHAVDEADGLLVGGEMRVDRRAGAQLCEPRDRVVDVPFLEQRDELFAEAGGREVADEAHLDAAAGEPDGVVVHPEPVAILVADGPEDARGVVDERQVVEDADRPGLQIAPAAEGVDQPASILPLQRDGHRVDREVAAEEILADRRVLDRRQGRRRVVELGAGRHHVHSLVVSVEDDRGAELLVHPGAAVERVGQGAGQRDRIALDGDVDVEVGLAEQDVAHGPADQVDAVVALADRGDGIEDRRQVLEPVELVGEDRSRLGAERPPVHRRPAGDRSG